MDESNSEPTFIAVGSGSEAIASICAAERALVMVSVPWSGPERKVRLLQEVAVRLQQLLPDRQVQYFRLEVDEEPAAEEWLIDLGYPEFILMGVGSLLWLEHGKVITVIPAPLGESVKAIVDRTSFLWHAKQPHSRQSI